MIELTMQLLLSLVVQCSPRGPYVAYSIYLLLFRPCPEARDNELQCSTTLATSLSPPLVEINYRIEKKSSTARTVVETALKR